MLFYVLLVVVCSSAIGEELFESDHVMSDAEHAADLHATAHLRSPQLAIGVALPDDGGPPEEEGAMFGDMVLSPAQKELVEEGRDLCQECSNSTDPQYGAVKGAHLRWTDGIIPYVVDCSIGNMPRAMPAVYAAMAEWEAKTCLRFVPHTNEKYKLVFFRNTHCWGNVGMKSYSRISVGYGCEYQHVMTHEIGHAVGFYHEQNRIDRDQYVKVNKQNIGQFLDAFDIVRNTDSLGSPYDYESIMHYPWTAFSSNGKPTMTAIRNRNNLVPYIKLSDTDAAQTSRMYNCPAIEAKRASKGKGKDCSAVPRDNNPNCGGWASGGLCNQDYLKKNCQKSCCKATKTPVVKKDCRDTHGSCPKWAQNNQCNQEYLKKNCRRSCNNPDHCPLVCKDMHTGCVGWAASGDCHREDIKKICTKSCSGRCKAGSLTPAPPTKPPHPTTIPKDKIMGIGILCADEHPKCAYYAAKGHCTDKRHRSIAWMRMWCKGSCKVTEGCDQPGMRPRGTCNTPLGLSFDGTDKRWTLPDSAFSAYDHLLVGNQGWAAHPWNARLYFRDSFAEKRVGAWCAISHAAARDPQKNWLQVDLGRQMNVKHIVTQGRDKYFERVSKFRISYSNDGRTFTDYSESGIKPRIFDGSCDVVTPIVNTFRNIIRARYIRFHPNRWNYPCVRMELYGC